MRKVILSVALSLDGMIEGPDGEYDWCPMPDQKEMQTFLNKIDTVFYGRKSYEMAGGFMAKNKVNYIFSNTLKKVNGKDSHLVKGDIISAVNEIRNQPGKDIWLFGGAMLTTAFLNAGLIDEMWLGIVPVVLGKGKPLFQQIKQRNYFQIVDSVNKENYLSVVLRKTLE